MRNRRTQVTRIWRDRREWRAGDLDSLLDFEAELDIRRNSQYLNADHQSNEENNLLVTSIILVLSPESKIP
jgi:hypothetical protein